MFPDTENATSRYIQKSFDIENQINTFANVVSPNNQVLKARDAMGITDFDVFDIKIITKSKILLVEVPMNKT